MTDCSIKQWKVPLYFHHYFYTYGKYLKNRELKWFSFYFFKSNYSIS